LASWQNLVKRGGKKGKNPPRRSRSKKSLRSAKGHVKLFDVAEGMMYTRGKRRIRTGGNGGGAEKNEDRKGRRRKRKTPTPILTTDRL